MISAFISTFSTMIPIILGIIVYNDLKKQEKIILLLCLISFLVDVYMMILALNGVRNILFSHIYNLAEILLISLFYFFNLRKSGFLILTAGVVIMLAYIFSIFNDVYSFNDLGKSIESIVFIVFSLLLFYRIYVSEENIFIESTAVFWVNTGIFLFFSLALFSFLMSEKILSGPLSWIFHNSANTLKNLLFAIGFLLIPKSKL